MANKKSALNTDLPDSDQDKEKLKQEVVTIDMPEVQDIPGQENIRVPDIREMQDVTISSADEEAEELLSEINTEHDSNEDSDENQILASNRQNSIRKFAVHESNDVAKDEAFKEDPNMHLDNKDEDNEELNEKGSGADRFGEDLDVPGSELDDANEETGEEDEENNSYSRPD